MESKDLLGKGWDYSGDVDALDYGGKWIRNVGGRAFQIVEFTNMDDACGRDNEGRDPYVVELSLVDLDAIGNRTIGDSLRSIGWTGATGDKTPSDLEIAEACHGYGVKAPLESWEGSNAHAMLRRARAAANGFKRNAAQLASALDRPVNKIGSTAREFMTGDLDSAVHRALGGAAGPEAKIAAGIIQKMDDAATIPCPMCRGARVTIEGCDTCKGRGRVVRTLGGLRPTL